MNRFSYLAEKIKESDFLDEPFSHLYIDNFFSDDDFASILACPEISSPTVGSDEQLISELRSQGYDVISFPGCITNVDDYIRWHSNRTSSVKVHTACEGFGMVLRLYEKKSQILIDLEEFLLSDEFNSTIAALNGGEDYELLFTINQNDFDKIKDHPYLTIIGNACDKKIGCQMITGLGQQIELTAQGWQSFSKI